MNITTVDTWAAQLRLESFSMLSGKWLFAALAATPVIADILSTQAAASGFWAQFLPSLYYVAIVVGGLLLGWKAGLGLAVTGGICHATISYLLRSSTWTGLEAQVVAFLVVGFALIEERRRATARIQSETPPNGYIDSRSCVEQVSEMTSEIMRQIRTPLTSVEGAAFLLRENSPELENPAEFVDIIARECDRVQSVLTEIAACSEMHPLECEATDLGSMLAETVRLSAIEVPDPQILLRTEIAADLPMVWCDKRQILDVLVPFVTTTMRSITGGGEVLLAADRCAGQARIRLSVLGQTVRAIDPPSGKGQFSSTFDSSGGLRLLAARRTLLQHGGSVQTAEAGHMKKLQFITLPLYDGRPQ